MLDNLLEDGLNQFGQNATIYWHAKVDNLTTPRMDEQAADKGDFFFFLGTDLNTDEKTSFSMLEFTPR